MVGSVCRALARFLWSCEALWYSTLPLVRFPLRTQRAKCDTEDVIWRDGGDMALAVSPKLR